MSKQQDAEERAFGYHDNGYHCAEAVSKAIMEFYCQRQTPEIPQAATAFGGGVGRTHEEMCGALSGALLALGLVLGRSQPGANWDEIAGLAAKLRERFIAEFGSSTCAVILEAFGEQTNMMKCKKLSGKTAAMTAEILESRSQV
ncbi:MAG: C-GCAxxG-C-C family protein [Desulfarculaceae bacterium]|jgi:C_GCAxxG_C_C family probable redox protein